MLGKSAQGSLPLTTTLFRRRAERLLLRLSGNDSHFRLDQRRMADWAVSFVSFSEVQGDYLEFGVFQGAAFLNAWDYASAYGCEDMRFFAFDSFQGLPSPSPSSVDEGGEFSRGQFACDRDTLQANLRRGGVDLDRVKIVEGFFEETLTDSTRAELDLKAAAVIWIDSDLYESAVSVLEFVTPLVVDGTVLVFDDWHCFHSRPDRGEQRACAEWLERNPDIRLVHYRDFHWAGRSFIVNRD